MTPFTFGISIPHLYLRGGHGSNSHDCKDGTTSRTIVRSTNEADTRNAENDGRELADKPLAVQDLVELRKQNGGSVVVGSCGIVHPGGVVSSNDHNTKNNNLIVLDAFGGCGGNAIAFATAAKVAQVIARA